MNEAPGDKVTSENWDLTSSVSADQEEIKSCECIFNQVTDV